MSGEWTREELAEKVESEGGVCNAIIGYGLESVLLPADVPAEVQLAWRQVYTARHAVAVVYAWLYPDE